jgi:hypothetical protein
MERDGMVILTLILQAMERCERGKVTILQHGVEGSEELAS